MSTIACCLCGTAIPPNDAAMCPTCLASQVDITLGIARTADLVQCKKCSRWYVHKDTWAHHELESASFLAVCLKKIHGLQKMKLLDAKWVWTEPHSLRLKVAIDVEGSVLNDKVTLRQRVVVEFVIKHKQCLECIREATDHTWGAALQLRQRSNDPSLSLSQLEQQLTAAGLHNLMLDVTVVKHGLDLYFKNKNQCERVVEFVTNRLPARVKTSKKLISSDAHNNTQRFEHVYLVEVAALVKGDLVRYSSSSNSGSAELMLVTKVSSTLHLTNPCTLRRVDVSAARYFARNDDILTLSRRAHKCTFIVLDVSPLSEEETAALAVNNKQIRKRNAQSSDAMSVLAERGGVLAWVEVARVADLGVNDTQFRVLSHLGHLLAAGDEVLGYDLTSMISSGDTDLDRLRDAPPDAILIKKVYANSGEKKKNKKNNRRRGKRGDTALPTSENESVELRGELLAPAEEPLSSDSEDDDVDESGTEGGEEEEEGLIIEDGDDAMMYDDMEEVA